MLPVYQDLQFPSLRESYFSYFSFLRYRKQIMCLGFGGFFFNTNGNIQCTLPALFFGGFFFSLFSAFLIKMFSPMPVSLLDCKFHGWYGTSTQAHSYKQKPQNLYIEGSKSTSLFGRWEVLNLFPQHFMRLRNVNCPYQGIGDIDGDGRGLKPPRYLLCCPHYFNISLPS